MLFGEAASHKLCSVLNTVDVYQMTMITVYYNEEGIETKTNSSFDF